MWFHGITGNAVLCRRSQGEHHPLQRILCSRHCDKWHGILSFGIYSTVCAQSLHLSHNSGHGQPVQSIIISGLFAELEEGLKSSTIPSMGALALKGLHSQTDWQVLRSLKNKTKKRENTHARACILFSALQRNILDSSAAPLTQIFTVRDQRNGGRKVKADRRSAAVLWELLCRWERRAGMPCGSSRIQAPREQR